jgi:sarcosine oxidase
MTNSYDAIVLGTGGVGSAALFHLAQRGLRVLGLDRFPGGHSQGSSHGETRIIRQAYFEHPDYVPLLLRAYALWQELEQRQQERLLHQVGLLQVGPPEGIVVPGVLASAQQHGLAVEQLSQAEIGRRFPAFQVPDNTVGVFEPAAGYLLVERCVLAHLAQAQRLGAEYRSGETVQSWRRCGDGVEVVTDGATYQAARLVIAAGAWSSQLLASLGLPLEIRRKHAYWVGPAPPQHAAVNACPTFLYELPQRIIYGFPAIDSLGLKVAEHSGGEVVGDPLHAPRALDTTDFAHITEFLRTHIPAVGRTMQRRSVCFYTMTPDEHFIIDRHPEYDAVVIAAGLSGHGFKFAAVLGQALAELACEGSTSLPIDFLSLRRPALRPGSRVAER